MLDNILNIVKDVAMDAVSKNADVPSDKKNLVVESATSAITSGLTSNIGGLTSLLTGGGSGSNSIVDSIQKSVVNSIAEKTGINPAIAGVLASAIVPTVISKLSGQVASKDSGFSIDSVLGALGGGDKKESGLGGALGALGKLFG